MQRYSNSAIYFLYFGKNKDKTKKNAFLLDFIAIS